MQRRSEGWRVRPSFTPQGPTSPVTLLLDERCLTQLAGEDPVAWQTPWTELHNLRLARTLFGTTMIADTDGRTFVWRTNRRVASVDRPKLSDTADKFSNAAVTVSGIVAVDDEPTF